jgi:dTDP-4-dehydrorhamnose reductase
MSSEPNAQLELWGGVECTVNRLGDRYLHQMVGNGHAERDSDLDWFAEIGFAALRFPVLWERTATNDAGTAFDWAWTDRQLQRMRELEMRPIAGLVHHGSGPLLTKLLDPQFGERLAGYARAVAQRYPWIEDYTPVNEPLTTARFSALYGHWYPHARDPLSFARALFNQLKGVVLSMRAIREVNPAARLIQTEDLAKVYSTSRLEYQAEFENNRRWLTFDLLMGRVDSSHPMWSYFRWLGVDSSELDWFLENSCPPDILGLNYYVVGERFLDERVERYPGRPRGSNGRDTYVDVSACRALVPDIAGAEGLLSEVWERYRRPIAVTEAHLSCTREEQMRWVMEIWNAARALRSRGGDVRAVTLWSLLGAFDWNSLLTRDDGHYESGVFDLRSPEPRATALAQVAKSLAVNGDYDHPVLGTPGWWRRPIRLLYPPTGAAQPVAFVTTKQRAPQRPLLITGGNGTVARAFARVCDVRGLAYRLLNRRQLDIADPASVHRALAWFEPWAVINAAGYVDVDAAEDEPEICWRENVFGADTLAQACAQHDGTQFVTFSSDLVFDGQRITPYDESAPTAPLSVYGRTKAEAELKVLSAFPSALVVRTSAFFGPWDQANFVHHALRALASGEEFAAADDETVSPTYVPDLVHAVLDILIDGESGIFHVANSGAVTWAELAATAATLAGVDASKLHAQPRSTLGRRAARPAFSALTSNRAWIMRPWQEALGLFFRDRRVARTSAAAPVPEPALVDAA